MKPDWLKIRPPSTDKFVKIRGLLKTSNLSTVCQEAHCPNMSECWSKGTATFMIMGDTCTRGCRFCSIKTLMKPLALDATEPERLVKAISIMNLKYVVITSVDRDDLDDGGAEHFAKCIHAVKKSNASLIIEVLIPDFLGQKQSISKIIAAGPNVIGHNIETVKRLQKRVRDPRANYVQSLKVLKTIKSISPKIRTKSSLMLGLGETHDEIIMTMADLRSVNVDFLSLGQYLRPSDHHLPVEKYIEPNEFLKFKEQAINLGFLYCASGPFVRSSYKAAESYMEGVLNEKNCAKISN